MRMSVSRIRSINRSIVQANGIICGASDRPRQAFPVSPKLPASAIPPHTVKIVVVSKPLGA